LGNMWNVQTNSIACFIDDCQKKLFIGGPDSYFPVFSENYFGITIGGQMNSASMRRRNFHAAALSLLLAPPAMAARPSTAPVLGKAKTFVLVHGAWYGGWCWDAVAQALRAQGHWVSTPTCPGLGEQAHLLSKDISLTTFI